MILDIKSKLFFPAFYFNSHVWWACIMFTVKSVVLLRLERFPVLWFSCRMEDRLVGDWGLIHNNSTRQLPEKMGMSKVEPAAVSGWLKSLSTRGCTQIYRSSSRVLGLSQDIKFRWYKRHNLSNSSSTHDLGNWDLTIRNDCRAACSSAAVTKLPDVDD